MTRKYKHSTPFSNCCLLDWHNYVTPATPSCQIPILKVLTSVLSGPNQAWCEWRSGMSYRDEILYVYSIFLLSCSSFCFSNLPLQHPCQDVLANLWASSSLFQIFYYKIPRTCSEPTKTRLFEWSLASIAEIFAGLGLKWDSFSYTISSLNKPEI